MKYTQPNRQYKVSVLTDAPYSTLPPDVITHLIQYCYWSKFTSFAHLAKEKSSVYAGLLLSQTTDR